MTLQKELIEQFDTINNRMDKADKKVDAISKMASGFAKKFESFTPAKIETDLSADDVAIALESHLAPSLASILGSAFEEGRQEVLAKADKALSNIEEIRNFLNENSKQLEESQKRMDRANMEFEAMRKNKKIVEKDGVLSLEDKGILDHLADHAPTVGLVALGTVSGIGLWEGGRWVVDTLRSGEEESQG